MFALISACHITLCISLIQDEVITQKKECHTLPIGFAGRVNCEKFSRHQTMWTPQRSNFSDKSIKEKTPCFAEGARFKHIFCFYFKCVFQCIQSLPFQLQSFCPWIFSRFTAYLEFQSRSKRFFNCSWMGSCFLCRLVKFCLTISPTPAVLMK